MTEIQEKIKVLANKNRYKIIELTQNKEISITELSKALNLAYTKCADYISVLEKKHLITKRKEGKLVFVKSKAKITDTAIKF